MVAGTGGDCGKTLVTLGLASAWVREGIPVTPFKKGPDYIDPAWLSLAAGRATHNLDTWMMEPSVVLRSFVQNADPHGINLIESNRGLHDGEDVKGTHSSAELSKLLKTPVLLIIPAAKVTRTVAAIALGIKLLDPGVEIAGVVLNRVSTSRQESVVRQAVESESGLSVLGVLRRIEGDLLPSRHLGLVTPQEHERARQVIGLARDIVSQSVDMAKLQNIASHVDLLETKEQGQSSAARTACGLRIGFFQSAAFTFYYPENLEAIDQCGAIRVPIDPLRDRVLPNLDALYIGGGFPETHAASLATNTDFRNSVAHAAQNGLPVWAECGGLMFLSRAVHWQGNRYPMAGVFPVEVTLGKTPAGHGYEEVLVDRPNPFVSIGTTLRGHEFHYSRVEGAEQTNPVFMVKRGTGLGNGRDGLVMHNVLASYLHLHVLGTPGWVGWLVDAASRFNHSRGSEKQM